MIDLLKIRGLLRLWKTHKCSEHWKPVLLVEDGQTIRQLGTRYCGVCRRKQNLYFRALGDKKWVWKDVPHE